MRSKIAVALTAIVIIVGLAVSAYADSTVRPDVTAGHGEDCPGTTVTFAGLRHFALCEDASHDRWQAHHKLVRGPRGFRGATGPAGPQGPAGTPGRDANVGVAVCASPGGNLKLCGGDNGHDFVGYLVAP